MLAGTESSKDKKWHLYFVRAKRCKANKNLHKKTIDYIVRKDSQYVYGERLGDIKWSGKWRQYVFYPDIDTIWSKGCLELINNFLDKVNKRHRNKLKRK